MGGMVTILAALALAQAEPGAPQAAPPAAPPAEAPAERTQVPAEPTEEPADRPPPPSTTPPVAPAVAAPPPAAAPGAAPKPTATPASAATTPVAPSPRPSPPRSGGEGGIAAPAAGPIAPAPPAPAPAAPAPATENERTQVARAALRFLDALVAGEPDALAAASAERFSFDGQVETGRDAVRREWRARLERRAGEPAALLDLDLRPAADAVARYGPPPARVASLARPGAWVAAANVSGRAVVLFLVRSGGAWTVAGMHD
jgi:outer membrane biosynthesis protein TonB